MSDPSIQGPGWYYAEGDPPGTKRYWDGNTWTQGPEIMQDGAPAPAGAMQSTAAGTPAAIGDRVIAWLIDTALIFAAMIVVFILGAILGAINEGLGAIVMVLGFLAMFAAGIYIFAWGQGVTGFTPGKRMMGCKVVDRDSGATIGGPKGLGRWLVGGVINSFCGIPISSLWAFVDKDNEALHDKILSTRVNGVEKGGIMPLFPDGKPF